jgi:hypothetical protein
MLYLFGNMPAQVLSEVVLACEDGLAELARVHQLEVAGAVAAGDDVQVELLLVAELTAAPAAHPEIVGVLKSMPSFLMLVPNHLYVYARM